MAKAKLKRLTRMQVLEAQDVRQEEFDVPEWGGSMLLKGMTVGTRREVMKAATEVDDRGQAQIDDAKMQMMAVVFCSIEPKFEPEDIEVLERRAAGVTQRVWNKITELSGYTEAQGKKPDEQGRIPAKGEKPLNEGDFTGPPASGS